MKLFDRLLDGALARYLKANEAGIHAAVKSAVCDYLDELPDAEFVSRVSKIVGAAGLTDPLVKRLIEAANGQRTIEVFFGNGDYAVVSNRAPREKAGPGW